MKLFEFLRVIKDTPIDTILENYLDTPPTATAGHNYESMWKTVFALRNYKHTETYEMCEGRIEESTMKCISNMEHYLRTENVNNGSKDGIVDVKLQLKDDKYIFMSSKYFGNEKSISEYDISDIVLHSKDYNYEVWLLVRDKGPIIFTKRKQVHTNEVSKILDRTDLQCQLITLQKKLLDTDWESILNHNENVLYIPYLHQAYFKNVLIRRIKDCKKVDDLRKMSIKLIMGFKCRAGKTYTIPLSFYGMKKHFQDNFNILVLLLNPTETKEDFIETFQMFPVFNVVYIEKTEDFDRVTNCKSNIIIISKQLVCHGKNREYIEKIKELKCIGKVIDEAHNGGMTDKTIELDRELNIPLEILVTYTYDKCKGSDREIIRFNSTQLTLCKNFHKNKSTLEDYDQTILSETIEELKIEHGCQTDEEIYNVISDQYKKFPKVNLEIFSLSGESEIIKDIKESGLNIGYNNKSVFEINNDGNWTNVNVLKTYSLFIFGDKIKNKNASYFGRVSRENNRTLDISKGVTVSLMFMPLHVKNGKIKVLTNKYKGFLLDTLNIGENYEIMCISSDEETIVNSKLTIQLDNKIKECKKNNKHLLILSGIMLHLAVTLVECDIVILANDTTSADKWLQMSERSGTPNEDKSDCYILDMNLHRSLTVLMERFGGHINKKEKLEETIKYLIKSEIMDISFNDIRLKSSNIEEIEESIQRIRSEYQQSDEIIKHQKYDNDYIDHKETNDIMCYLKDSRYKDDIKNLLYGKVLNKSKKEKIDVGGSEIPKGEEIVVDPKNKGGTGEKSNCGAIVKEKTETMDLLFINKILNNIFKLTCYLFIIIRRDNNTLKPKEYKICELSSIFHIVYNKCEGEFNTHLQSWYEGNTFTINSKALTNIIKALKHNLRDNNINILMNDLTNNIHNPIFMCQWCDSNLVSSDINRMDNGEVFTPLEVIDDMFLPMKKINPNYIHKDMKVLDIGAGRGNGSCYMYNMLYYHQNIIDDFPNETDRRDHILKNMLYMSEMNKDNICILKDLFGRDNPNIIPGDAIGSNNDGDGIRSVNNPKEFKLYQYFQELNINFDIIYTNPPYQKPNKKDPGRFNGQPFYFHFVRLAIELLKPGGLLFAIHPPTWKKISNERSAHNTEWFIQDNTLLYLNCSDKEDKFHGKTQKAVDFYILQKKKNDNKTTTIVDSEYKGNLFHGKIQISPQYKCLPKHLNHTNIRIYDKLTCPNKESFQLTLRRYGENNEINDKNKYRHRIDLKGKKVHINEPNEEYQYKVYGQYQNNGPCFNYTSNKDIKGFENRVKVKLICGIKINIENFPKSFVIDKGGEIIPGYDSLHMMDNDIDKLEYIHKVFSSNLFIYILKMCCYSRTNQGLDQIEYHFLNNLYIPNREIINQENINKGLYEYYGITTGEILFINRILNDKESIISKDWKKYQEKYNIIGKKEKVIHEVIQKCIVHEIDTPDTECGVVELDINGDQFNYDYINNKFRNNEGIDITDEYCIKYTIVNISKK